MKYSTSAFLIIFTLILSSYSKSNYYEATVLEKGNCVHLTIKLDEAISHINLSTDLIYMTNELPEYYQIIGEKIKVKLRNPEVNEHYVCPAFGIGYGQVVILGIKDL